MTEVPNLNEDELKLLTDFEKKIVKILEKIKKEKGGKGSHQGGGVNESNPL
jgi:hypothetical protein